MRRRNFLALAGTAGASLAMSGTLALNGVAKAADQYTVVAIPKARSPWSNQIEAGVKQAAKDLGVKAFQQAPESADEALQVRLINDAINQGTNAILVLPNDAKSVVPAFKKAQGQNIVVITHESPQQENADFDVELIDNKAFATASMDLLSKSAGADGGEYVVFVGSLTVPAHNLWADIATAHGKEAYPKLKLVAERYPVGEDQSAAHQTALDILTAHPNLKGFLCFGSQGGPGAAQAIAERGPTGKVAVVGTTTPKQAAQYLKAGSMSAAIIWDPGEAGYAMVHLAKLVLDGKKATISANLDIPTLGKPLSVTGNTIVYDRPLILTKDNVDQHATF